ncbi:hypothetical protein QVD17_02780 [Tagetes erecta]|uniref:Uncharacterized protein n=1 Tax=Tagetes erecta TaxID=13708 RepID=A0AAD8P9G2_TARER|nr:hypothetical protein QVD17_02780 [Tagetes erecta]
MKQPVKHCMCMILLYDAPQELSIRLSRLSAVCYKPADLPNKLQGFCKVLELNSQKHQWPQSEDREEEQQQNKLFFL